MSLSSLSYFKWLIQTIKFYKTQHGKIDIFKTKKSSDIFWTVAVLGTVVKQSIPYPKIEGSNTAADTGEPLTVVS
jgi:hypothetical protein